MNNPLTICGTIICKVKINHMRGKAEMQYEDKKSHPAIYAIGLTFWLFTFNLTILDKKEIS